MNPPPNRSLPRREVLSLFTVATGALLVPASAHAQRPPPGAPPAGEPGSAANAPLGPAPGSRRVFNGLNEEHILHEIQNARIRTRRQVGSTSVNFHLTLASDVEAAYKPRSSSHGEAYRAEIAAYRLNRLLGIARVPPAIQRVVPRSQLRLSPETLVVAERDGNVRGAAIYWVPVLRESRIDQERERARWGQWLRQRTAVPPEQSTRAEEISTLVVFDFLTGNWDRWSGQNVPMDSAGHLVYRDNNGGFTEPFGPAMLANVMRHLRLVQKFSRGVIDHARAFTEASVRAEMALDGDPAHPPLNATQITSLLQRRDALTAYVDDLVRRFGESAVYPWA